jgi:hypothetical protein
MTNLEGHGPFKPAKDYSALVARHCLECRDADACMIPGKSCRIKVREDVLPFVLNKSVALKR